MKKITLLLFPIFSILLINTEAQITKDIFLRASEDKYPSKTSYISQRVDGNNLSLTINVDASQVLTSVPDYLYGVNSSIYMGDITNNATDVSFIQSLSPHVIRYPGGDIANVFFWDKHDGDKILDVPDTLAYVNPSVQNSRSKQTYWKGLTENPSRLSVDDYYTLLSKTKSTGLISVNYSYARYGLSKRPVEQAAHYAADWVRYDNGRTLFWEIGNENYGAWEAGYKITPGGDDQQPEIINGTVYGQQASVFIDSMKAAAKQVGKTIFIGVHLTEHSVNANIPYKTWNEEVLKQVGGEADFFIVHSYFTPKGNSSSEEILNSPQIVLPKIVTYLDECCKKAGTNMRPVALTEWNIAAVGNSQATSTINGMHAVLVLGEAIKANFGLAARWALVQGNKQQGDDKGIFNRGKNNIWEPYPVYYYLYFFQKYFGNKMIETSQSNETGDVVTYASTFTSGDIGIVIVNRGSEDLKIKVNPSNFSIGENYYWYSLAGNANSQFPQAVMINGISATADNYRSIKAYQNVTSKGINLPVPHKSVQFILIEKHQ